MVNVDWIAQSFHEHKLKDGLAGCLVAQHGELEQGKERRIYCFTKCRIGRWLVHCHPNERGKGPWYDWVMVKKNGPGGCVRYVPARVASFFINEDDQEMKLQIVVQFVGQHNPKASSVLVDIYKFSADDPSKNGDQAGTYDCVDYQDIVKAVYAKVSSDLTKVVVVKDQEEWADAFI